MAPTRKRYPRLPEVMGSTEVAAELGVLAQNINAIPDLPEPDRVIAAGRVWRADKIRDFAQVFKERRAARRSQADSVEDPEAPVAAAA